MMKGRMIVSLHGLVLVVRVVSVGGVGGRLLNDLLLMAGRSLYPRSFEKETEKWNEK